MLNAMRTRAAALVLLSNGYALTAQAAPTAGVDCGCGKTGDHVLPLPAVDLDKASALTGLSPGGKYSVSATQTGNAASITVTNAATSEVLLANLPAAAWGFGPNENRFVVYHFVAGVSYASLYNLEAQKPLAPVHESASLAQGVLAFSPHGLYALEMRIPPSLLNHFEMSVFDAATGASVYHDEIAFGSASGLPPGQLELGSVRVGFGPDAGDRSLVYGWISSPLLQKDWTLVNLARAPAAGWFVPSSYDFRWGFSPCGDVFSVVSENPELSQKTATLYATLDGAIAGSGSFPIGESSVVTTTATQHVHGAVQLGASSASASCAGPQPVAPVAAFTVGQPRLRGVPIPFTDHSTSSSGSIVARQWSFGDGGGSSDASPTHAYGALGTYTVRLTVTNSGGRADTVQHSVVIAENQPPVPSFTFAPATPSSRAIVHFTDTSTDDDVIQGTNWRIGRDNYTGQLVDAKVCAPTTSVTLGVTDSIGQYAETTLDIPVSGSDRVPVAPGGDLGAAAAAACPGDTLVLETGTYPGGMTLSEVNVEGAGPGQSIIDGADASGWVLTLTPEGGYPNTQSVSIAGVTVSGGVNVPAPSGQPNGGGIYLAGTGQVTLRNVEVSGNSGRAGYYAYHNSQKLVVESSTFHHNAGTGLAFSLAGVTVTNSEFAFNELGARFDETAGVSFAGCEFHDNRGPGLVMDDTEGAITHSRFYGNGSSPGSYAVVLLDSSAMFAGNLVAENHGGGVVADRRPVIHDSTIANNCGSGLHVQDGHVFNTIVAGNAVDLDGTLTDDVANLIGTNPGFIGSGDFHLSEGSPALDQGDASRVPAWLDHDADGDARVLARGSGTALLDIGWDEWRDGQPTTGVPTLACSVGNGGTGGSAGSGGSGGAGGMNQTGGSAGASTTGGMNAAGQGAGGEGTAGEGTAGEGTAGEGTAGEGTAGKGAGDAGKGSGGLAGDAEGGQGGDGADHGRPTDDNCGCRLVGTGRPRPLPFGLATFGFALLLFRRRGARQERRG